MTTSTHPPNQTDLDAALLLLTRMGISPDDLRHATPAQPPAPTFDAYIDVVAAAVSPGTLRVYGSYWKRIRQRWGSRRLDEPTPTEIKQFAEYVKTHTVQRCNARGGRSAAEHLIAAMRCIYAHAVNDGLIAEQDNPARKVEKPRRLPSTRRAIADNRLEEINRIAATTGNDPELDSLILRLHTETACRRGGALAVLPADLDPDQCLVRLHEKGETVRWQPISPTLMRHLQRHIQQRPAPRTTPVLRYSNGRPITRRRYDYLWDRIGRHLPWVATQQISTHWLRHTTLTWVERSFGYAVARAYAGHTDNNNEPGSTATYVRATLQEVAVAVATLTREPHPLA